MYQRATLTIARIIGNAPANKIQLVLTPNWMGLLSSISVVGLYGSYILIWLQLGFIWAFVLFLLNHLLNAIIPIPTKYFYNIVEKHLKREIKRNSDKKQKAALVIFFAQVKQIIENSKVT